MSDDAPRKRVFHIINGLGLGGAEGALARLIPSQVRSDIEPIVISLAPTDYFADAIRDAGVAVHHLDIETPWQLCRSMFRLRTLLRRYRPEQLHCWMYHAAVISAFPPNGIRKIACIRHSLDSIETDSRSTRLATMLLRRGQRAFDAFVFNSHAARAQHVGIGFEAERSIVISNGFDSDRYVRSTSACVETRQALGLPEDATVLLAVGRYHAVKNHEGAIAAFNAVAADHPNAHLVMAGEGVDPSNASLTAEIAKGPAAPRIHLIGGWRDMPALYSAADVLVSASLGEAFPNVIAEAMLCGCAVIATDVGDTRRIAGEDNAILPKKDGPAMSAAIARFLATPREERRALGDRNRASIVSRFGVDVEAAAYGALYADIAAGRPVVHAGD